MNVQLVFAGIYDIFGPVLVINEYLMKSDNSTRPKGDPTRKAILKAAKHLFVKKGFAATSISEIAAKAKINQSLIYHHFGSKEDLWKHVKSAVLESYMRVEHLDLEDIGKVTRL